MKAIFLWAVMFVMVAYPAQSNPIERACLQSDRAAATRSLCNCIGQVADRTLTQAQMREGARFFTDPQRAQDVRMSNRRSDERMWDAWRAFGERAEATCG
ncbi:MAG: hypothetical protein NXH79_06215 [Rhodobacteraceae bacterium]|jgi:hypothetical protein|nr:hypothetical protein [Paracoccaceae bacterium]